MSDKGGAYAPPLITTIIYFMKEGYANGKSVWNLIHSS